MNINYSYLLVLLTIVGAVFLTGVIKPPELSPSQGGQGIPITATPDPERQNLQLGTIPFITTAITPPVTGVPVVPTVPSGRKCERNSVKDNCECDHIPDFPGAPEITCSNTNNCSLWQVCVQNNWPDPARIAVRNVGGTTLTYWLDCTWLKKTLSDGREYCLAKPVIYLYPMKPTMVDVRVETPGNIFVSDPLYPEGGWKNVHALPDGTLTYENKTYKELFYETTVKEFNKPNNGFIVKRENLTKELTKLLLKLGLNTKEKNDFISYWSSTLNEYKEPYMLISLIEKEEKERIDHIVIDPEPDTRIEFLVYFKPLKKIIDVPELKLPPTPKRFGFIEVEWGGVIDDDKGSTIK